MQEGEGTAGTSCSRRKRRALWEFDGKVEISSFVLSSLLLLADRIYAPLRLSVATDRRWQLLWPAVQLLSGDFRPQI